MNPWKVLGISPTSDAQAIRAAWLRGVKQHHPDLARTPEGVRKRTIRCSRLNIAYDAALHEAATVAAAETQPRSTHPRMPSAGKASHIGTVWSDWLAWALLPVGLFALWAFMYGGVPWLIGILSKSSIAPVAMPVFGILLSIFVLGFVFLGAIDLFLFFLLGAIIPHSMMDRLGLRPYELKLIWLFVLIFNLWFTIGSGVIGHSSSSFASPSLDAINSVLAAITVPTWIAIDWIRTKILFHRIGISALARIRTHASDAT